MPEATASSLGPLVPEKVPCPRHAAARAPALEFALNESGIGWWDIDVVNGRADRNDAWFAVVGWSRSALSEENIARGTHCHEDDFARLAARWLEYVHGTTETYAVEYRVRTANGEWRWVLDRGAATDRDRKGRALRIVGTTLDIDARKRAESAVCETEERYRTMADYARGCVYEYTFDDAGHPQFVWGNAGIARVFGLSPEEIIARDWIDRVHPEDRAAAAARLERQRKGEATVGECRVFGARGEERRLRVLARPFLDAAGRVSRVVAVAHDVTDTLRMQEALEYSEFRYRTIAALTPGYAHEFRIREDGVNELVWASEGFRDVYGCDHVEFTRRGGWEAFCHPDDLGASLERESRWTSGRQTEGLARIVSLSGEMHWLRCINRPLVDPVSGRVTAIVGIGHDITALMRSHEAVRRSEERFRRAVDAMAGLVYEADLASGEVLRWPGLERLLGYCAGEIPNTLAGWAAIAHPEDRVPGPDSIPRVAADTSDIVEFEYRARNSSGGYEHLLDRAVVMRDATGRPTRLIGCITNVSERKHLERELIEISNREQQRIGNDLHDGLGQELTGVALMLRSLAHRLNREHPVAVESVEQTLTLVNGAIESARTLARGLSPANLERGGLEFALRDLTGQLARASGVTIDWHSRGGGLLRVDETAANHIYRIAQEAISNALRHARASSIEVELEVTQSRVWLRVADDGAGFDGSAQRDGMGMKIMQYRARMIGGTLTVRARAPIGVEILLSCGQPEK